MIFNIRVFHSKIEFNAQTQMRRYMYMKYVVKLLSAFEDMSVKAVIEKAVSFYVELKENETLIRSDRHSQSGTVSYGKYS